MTKNKKIDLLITIGLFIISLVLFSQNWKFSLNNPDNLNFNFGVSTVGAERVLNGEIPYRDFWTMYAPGQFYLLAAIFAVFGKHLMVEVIAASIITSASVCACYWVVRSFSEKKFLAIASAAIFFGAMYDTLYFQRVGSYPTGIFFVFLALFFTIQYFKTKRHIRLFYAGLATGAIFIFKHDVGLYALIAILAGLIAHRFILLRLEKSTQQSLLNQVIYLFSGAAIIALPVLIYFSLAAGKDMLQNLIIFPLTDFRYARPEDFPDLIPLGAFRLQGSEVIEYLIQFTKFTIPLILTLLGLVGIWIAIKKRAAFLAACSVMVVTGFSLHYYAAHIQINTHIISIAVYSSWIGIILYELMFAETVKKRDLFKIAVIFVVAISWIFVVLYKPVIRHARDLRSYQGDFTLEKISGFRASNRQEEKFGILKSYVEANVPENEEIYVGLNRHDAILINDIMIYFLLDRPIATRYHELHPAIADTSAVQQEIIQELKDKKVRVVILKRIFSREKLNRIRADFQKHLPNVGAKDLDEFIILNYVPVQRVGPYEIWKLNDS